MHRNYGKWWRRTTTTWTFAAFLLFYLKIWFHRRNIINIASGWLCLDDFSNQKNFCFKRFQIPTCASIWSCNFDPFVSFNVTGNTFLSWHPRNPLVIRIIIMLFNSPFNWKIKSWSWSRFCNLLTIKIITRYLHVTFEWCRL